MSRSFLALFRGADGRSLARALACLLLANAIVSGLAQGAMAAADPAGVICTSFGSTVAPATGGDHPGEGGSICCEMGCAPELPALAASPAAVPAPSVMRDRGPIADAAAPAVRAFRPLGHSPRGPPLLA